MERVILMSEKTLEYMRKTCFADGKKVMQLKVLAEIDKYLSGFISDDTEIFKDLQKLRKRIERL